MMNNIKLDDEENMELLQNLMSDSKFDKKFLEERKIFLWGGVDDHSAKNIVNRLLYLEAKEPGKEISFYISSPGGMVTSGMVVLDTMNMITSPVKTICMGLAASMGSMLFSAGEKGRRFIYPNARVMIHQPLIGGIQGQASDLEIHAKEMLKTKEKLAQILADNCGKDFDKVMEDMERDYWMDPEASVEYGIADKIVQKVADLG